MRKVMKLSQSEIMAKYPDRHIALAIFNRATYARCRTVIDQCSQYANIKLTVILSSSLLMSEYGNAKDYIRNSDQVDFVCLECPVIKGGHHETVEQSGNILASFNNHFRTHKYDCVVVVADRYEVLPAAMAAAYNNIPLAHIQGGEITGNIDEKVRHAVTKLSDYHFTCTELSRDYVICLGEDHRRVHYTGCPSVDLVMRYRIQKWNPKERYCLSIFHPETDNLKAAYEQTRAVLEATLEYCSKHSAKCYWFYPNPDPGREGIVDLLDTAIITHPQYLIKAINKPPELFLRQLAGAKFIVGNSSCGIRECSFIGVPAINVGDRQRLRERHFNVIDVSADKEEIFKAMEEQHACPRFPRSALYGSGNAGRLIAEWLSKIDFSLKPALQYPFQLRFKERHFGPDRYARIQKKAKPSTSPATRALYRKSKPGSAESQYVAAGCESGSVGTGANQDSNGSSGTGNSD